jgi:hypothetical protein
MTTGPIIMSTPTPTKLESGYVHHRRGERIPAAIDPPDGMDVGVIDHRGKFHKHTASDSTTPGMAVASADKTAKAGSLVTGQTWKVGMRNRNSGDVVDSSVG